MVAMQGVIIREKEETASAATIQCRVFLWTQLDTCKRFTYTNAHVIFTSQLRISSGALWHAFIKPISTD